MPIQIYWEDTEKTIVRYDFQGAWTWDDLYAVYYQAIDMETSVPHRVDIILDMRTSQRIPGNALLHIKNIAEKQPPNVGLSIFVTTNAFITSMYNMAIKVYGKIAYYFRLVSTLDDAHAMIENARRPAAEKDAC
jgi:hypothetical protein